MHRTVESGLQSLTEGRWGDARAAFEAALAERETPEALEGLSWAAWWLDDVSAVFDTRERAYRLYRKRFNAPSAARMAIWLAIDHVDFHGALAVATGWLQRATRLLEPIETGPEHGWLAFQEGYLAHLGGDAATAASLARRAADIGRRFGIADLEMLGLALEGGALVTRAEVTDGMRCLDEAAATALEGDATVPISSAWALCFLVTACLDVRDLRRAFEWSDRIAEFAERYRSRYMAGFCRAHYGAIHLARGRWTDAETELLAAVDAYSRSRPAMVGEALVWLAELRRRQGRAGEVRQLLERAGEGGAALVCRGLLALDEGDAQYAAELAERCLRHTPADRLLDRAPALELLLRARVAQAAMGDAASVLEELQAVEALVGTPPLRASVSFGEGILAAAVGEHERARRCLEDAADAFDRVGTAFEALTARIELGATLLALGRASAAEQEAGRALRDLIQLGAEPEAVRARALLEACGGRAAVTSAIPNITPRERDILELLAEGLTNRQIAERLVVSDHTVHRHVTNILRKLDLPSRAAAAAYAVRTGILAQANG